MTGEVTAQPDDPLTLALTERWLDPGRNRIAGFRRAFAVALAGHLILGVLLTGGFDGLLGGLLGPGRDSRRAIGDKAGEIDGVAAEVIDAAEFNKRYVSFNPGRAQAETEAQAQQPAHKAAAQPDKQNEPVADLKPADGWEPVQPTSEPREERPPQEAKPRTQTQPAQQPLFSEAEMREIITQSVEDIQSALVSVSTPGAARLGEASPFVRAVIRILKNHMPRPSGMKGKVLLQLFVGPAGDIEAIRVARSSGRADLDRFVIERVARTKLPAPPATASPRERLFQISYEYN